MQFALPSPLHENLFPSVTGHVCKDIVCVCYEDWESFMKFNIDVHLHSTCFIKNKDVPVLLDSG
jgi:hypothetical protein